MTTRFVRAAAGFGALVASTALAAAALAVVLSAATHQRPAGGPLAEPPGSALITSVGSPA